ncbi:hypothetical protein [Streptomyces sp. CB03234]|uniref:hypothetical protein n=1 Tax=Streptomyces sp. (strain CB03234) TaxID=1703937 RepID=UPI000A60DC57
MAAAPLGRGRLVTLTTDCRPGDTGAEHLIITLRFPHLGMRTTLDPRRLPLPGHTAPDGSMVWHLPIHPTTDRPARIVLPSPGTPLTRNAAGYPATAPSAASDVDHALVEEELRAALARGDALAEERRRLEHELAETNSGVLALYVQLEERDEQLRTAHRRTLRALEDALRPRPLTVDGVELAVHYAPASDDDPPERTCTTGSPCPMERSTSPSWTRWGTASPVRAPP